jgi:hypothetical protein
MRIAAAFVLIFLLAFGSTVLAQESIEKLNASINGTIINLETNPSAMISSENGMYWCTYNIIAVTDEMRELKDLKFHENEDLIFRLTEVPGSDLSITNSGKIIFYDHSEHFNGTLKLIAFSKTGEFIFKKEFQGATQFEFSASGEMMGVRTPAGTNVISLDSGNDYEIKKGLQLSFGKNDKLIALARQDRILIYEGSLLKNTIQTGIELPRKVIISSEKNLVALIDKYNLKIYSVDEQSLIFKDKIGGDLSFRDLKIVEGKIVAGIHKRNQKESAGFLRVYDLKGNILEERSGKGRQLQKFERLKLEKQSQMNYKPIPWPFFPFDSMRTVWNHYEQHMGSNPSSTYLHQGLDLITPISEPTYSVIDGYVKLVLTIGGAAYWRIAVSDTQSAEWSEGWLSAHLIESTIQYEVGDTVHVHDYLGDIIDWTADWGHIHFVNITDSGLVWFYNDNEWGINFNPSLVLAPYPDTTAPYIDQVFTWSKFAFAVNESATYLSPDSLFGSVDIIVKVVDYAGDSQWQQPAYTTWITVKRISDGEVIKPRTLGHILNHKYPFYSSGNYQPYAGVIFQRDNTLQPSSWMDMQRNFYHNLTNSNGDSLIELSEKSLSFETDQYSDDDYRIIVEVYDESGNFDVDSMDVKFRNGNPVKTEYEEGKIHSFSLAQNYPNPFNPSTKIKFTIPSDDKHEKSSVILKVYDILGNDVATLVNEELTAGEYEVEFNLPAGRQGTVSSILLPASGIYFYQLRAADFIETKKMVLLK